MPRRIVAGSRYLILLAVVFVAIAIVIVASTFFLGKHGSHADDHPGPS